MKQTRSRTGVRSEPTPDAGDWYAMRSASPAAVVTSVVTNRIICSKGQSTQPPPSSLKRVGSFSFGVGERPIRASKSTIDVVQGKHLYLPSLVTPDNERNVKKPPVVASTANPKKACSSVLARDLIHLVDVARNCYEESPLPTKVTVGVGMGGLDERTMSFFLSRLARSDYHDANKTRTDVNFPAQTLLQKCKERDQFYFECKKVEMFWDTAFETDKNGVLYMKRAESERNSTTIASMVRAEQQRSKRSSFLYHS